MALADPSLERAAQEPKRSRPIRVAIVDKNPLLRTALSRLVTEDGRFELVLSATDGRGLVDRCAEIDVVVTGWVMPEWDGRRILEALRGLRDAPRVVVYSGSAFLDVPEEVMRLGGAAFCGKTEPPERLLGIVEDVAEGKMIFPFVDVRKVGQNPMDALTARERDLLRALSKGRTNAQLSRDLGVSVNTIKFHLGNLYDKLGVKNRAQAVAFFLNCRRCTEDA